MNEAIEPLETASTKDDWCDCDICSLSLFKHLGTWVSNPPRPENES